MDLLDVILTSLVDAAFPVMRDEPDNPSCPLPLCLLNPAAYERREVEDSHDE